METVKLSCTNCSRLMTIKEEHIGKPVRCPYCQAVVKLTPPTNFLQPTEPDQHDPFRDEPAPDNAPATSFLDDPAPAKSSHDSAEEQLPSFVVRRPRNSVFVPILLLFLIPYCLAATGFIVYLLYQQRMMQFDPLERLPDPKADDGGARQVQHDLKLPAQLRTTLQQAVHVGALEVTPVKILSTPKDDQLVLVLDMHNISEDQEFNPIHEEFAQPKNNFSSYIFLEPTIPDAKVRLPQRLYGGRLQWALLEDGKERATDQSQLLRPGQHMLVRLTSSEKDRASVQWFLKHPQEMVWRVRVRRGLMATASGLKSATAVIGVQFNSGLVDKM